MLQVLNRVFRPAGVEWSMALTQNSGDGRRLAQAAVDSGAEVVAAYGGDGTVMEVASALVGTSVPLAILPGGSGNVLAAEFNLPVDLAEAAALLVAPTVTVRSMDVGSVGEHIFLTRIGLGLEAEVIQETDRDAKNRMGWMAYALTLLQNISDPPISRYSLVIDGQPTTAEGVMCVVANSGMFSPNGGIAGRALSLGPDVRPDDGLLDVVIIRNRDIGSLLGVAASLVAGNDQADGLIHWLAREVSIQADPPQIIQCDGEIIGPTPVTAWVLPGALRVVVPTTSMPSLEGGDRTSADQDSSRP